MSDLFFMAFFALSVANTPSDYAATLQFLSSLVWPGALLWLVWRFRPQVEQLLVRLARIKVGDKEIVFQSPSANAAEPTETAKEAILELPPDSFVPVSGIRTIVERSGLLDQAETVTNHLLLFQSPAQHTWLIATTNHMFVVLDDAGTRSSTRLIQTSLPRDEVLPLEIGAQDGAGIVRFHGEKTWWYFSPELFPNRKSLKDSVSNLLNQNV